jgi:hypothetical protein
MLNKIKFLLNTISTREFTLTVIVIVTLFIAKTYNELMPEFIKYENNKKILLNQNKLLNKYQYLLKQQDSKDYLLNQKQHIKNKGKALKTKELNTSKYFNNFKTLYLYLCNIENKYLIKKVTINHTDIKGLIQTKVFATTAKLKPKKCLINKKINLTNIFFTKKLTVFSIISNKVKINDLWYSKEANISKHIFIKDIKPTSITIQYFNEIKIVLLGGHI